MAERFETIYSPAARYALPAVDESTLRAMRANSADREEPPQYAQLVDYVRMGGCAWGLRKDAETSEAFVYAAMSRLMVRRLARA
jgi:hypothetical protein